MAHLYRHLRVHQVFGANTDVGKTILTTALCRAAVRRASVIDQLRDGTKTQPGRLSSPSVFYLKPVSTGPSNEADSRYVFTSLGYIASNANTNASLAMSADLPAPTVKGYRQIAYINSTTL